jgi:hypothetical protein|tara:strand:+ start:357 stop:632 length:276 start_codon:yes stop_codon:yes gene_type:complete
MWLLAFLILVNLFILYQAGNRRVDAVISTGEEWTIYGTMGCGWTRKQLEYMENNGKAFKFVDCEKEGCSAMKAFPTILHPSGETTVGYSEF